jgi:aminopeptidase N
MRDLALVVGPLEQTQRKVGDITLNAWMLAEHASWTRDMLDFTAQQVRTLQSEIGDYPFAELDVVDAPGAFGGIEYPGEVFIGVVGEGSFFERATVHETGHQWFYSVIGDDQLLEPWLDEAAASYTEILYEEKTSGKAAARRALRDFADALNYSSNPELPIGLPIGDYPTQSDYGILVYAKGALFFDQLRQTMGDEVFFAFLKAYYAKYRYGFVSSSDFQATAEETCACDLKALFDLWVYQGGPVNP